ncbi:haloperoxidase [Dictyobacter sp. S3.2.2.5]|uniref:Haloperoxidase n=1 Tax=Dictyobacter halimunensis TaxID=3026934 RepID=A0ABQ6FNM2_9CHLR|nr:haloperoxidase [Dictyobacter sp. S3.2.2.5]
MKKLILLLATFIGIFAAIGSPGVALAASSAMVTATNGGNISTSGAIVIAWNQELLHIVQKPGAQPATVHPTRSFAMLHAAIYDSVVSITRDAPTYGFLLNAPSGARPDAAAATAGHDTLAALYPTMKGALDHLLADELSMIPGGVGKQGGMQVGHAIAEHLVASRAHDGSAAIPPPFVPGNQVGNYRPTPPNFAAPVFTQWANVTPFVLNTAAQFRPGPPPALISQPYAQALNEVKSLGQNSSKTRTVDQTVAAKFWAGPIWNTWNEVAENAALVHQTNLESTARLFAVLNLSLADSTTALYDAKYHYQLWRPITAVREANTVGNALTSGDPTWTPLAITAPDPSYPGAHSTISAVAATVLSDFFGNQDHVRVTSDVLSGTVRTFASYTDVATEAGLSRIFAGQHTRLDHESGIKLGHNIAQLVLSHFSLGVPK